MPLQVQYTYFPKTIGGKYDFDKPHTLTEILGDETIPTLAECEALMNRLMARRDVLVSEVQSACIVIGELEIEQDEGQCRITKYPDIKGLPREGERAAATATITPAGDPIQANARPAKKDDLADEIKALLRGGTFQKCQRQIYYDPPDPYLIQLSQQRLLSRDGSVDESRSLVLKKKLYAVVAEANNPKGTGLLCVIRNERGKLVAIPEHFVIDHMRDELSNNVSPERGPRLDFGRTIADGPGDRDLRSTGSTGNTSGSISVNNPADFLQQLGIAPNSEIPEPGQKRRT